MYSTIISPRDESPDVHKFGALAYINRRAVIA